MKTVINQTRFYLVYIFICIRWENNKRKIEIENVTRQTELTLEYMRLKGRLIAMLRIHTKLIFRVTRFLVLLRPNFIGYRRLR